MPNIVMHHHFGKVVYSALSDEVKKSIGYIDLYDFATTGPDSFEKIHFLNNKNNNDHKLFSEQMHTKKSKDFFMKMIEMARVDYHMFSYLCGFVTHYFLDVYTNPFIFHLSGLYDPTDESTIEYRGMSEKLKLAYDCYVIENYYDCKPHAFRINRKILKLRKIKKTFKGSLDRLYSSIYGKTEGYKYVNSAIRWQKIYYALTFVIVAAVDIVCLYFYNGTLGGFGAEVVATAVNLMVFAVKTFIMLLVFIWVRWTLPRFRYDQIQRLGWEKLMPLSILNIIITALVVVYGN